MGKPDQEDHKKIHENFKKSFSELLPKNECFDNRAIRMALTDAIPCIIAHNGKTDMKYAKYYEAQR